MFSMRWGCNIFARPTLALEAWVSLLREEATLVFFYDKHIPFSHSPAMSSVELEQIIDIGNDL